MKKYFVHMWCSEADYKAKKPFAEMYYCEADGKYIAKIRAFKNYPAMGFAIVKELGYTKSLVGESSL
jgi:hypothetical protein